MISIQFDPPFGFGLKIRGSWLEYVVPLLELLESSVEKVQDSKVGLLPLPLLLMFMEKR